MNRNILAIIGFGIALFLSSCATSSIRMQVLIPAEISVPPHIKNVVIANRSLPEKEEKWINILEGFITGESVFADREGSSFCTKGLANQLNDGPRFKATLKTDFELRGTGTREYPLPLDWSKVKEVCSQYNADALIILETFDSDIDIRQGSREVEKTINKRKVLVTEYIADLNINVNSGWRIYDVKENRIIEEKSFMDNKYWKNTSESQMGALAGLPSKRDAINQAGVFSGMMFGRRISPNWQWVSRQYYVRKHDDFKAAEKFVDNEQWDNAAQIWNKLTNNADKKIAGRACYNMALAAEMKGDLNLALVWAEKAYQQFDINAAREYIKIIKTRIYQQEKLKEQMEK